MGENKKKEYPINLKWYPDIYCKMYNFYKYGIIPEERFNNTSNPRVYISRFKELTKKSFYYESDRLYFIKVNNSIRLSNWGFEDINKVQLKRIPYTYDILPKLDQSHEKNGHIAYRTLAKKFWQIIKSVPEFQNSRKIPDFPEKFQRKFIPEKFPTLEFSRFLLKYFK